MISWNKIKDKIFSLIGYLFFPFIKRLFLPHFNNEVRKIVLVESLKEKAMSDNSMLTEQSQRNPRIIVSLTTFEQRIYSVFIVLESIAKQTMKPDKVILWLAEDEYSNDTIPITLKNMQNRGLEIKYCEDIKSYKKIIPALEKFPQNLIITIDDDAIYPNNLVESLYKTYIKFPDCICCYRAHRMKFNRKGKLLSYNKWEMEVSDLEPSLDIFPTGVGGVLYYPGCFHHDVTNKKLFMKLAPYADDVWLKYMSFLKGIKCKLVDYPVEPLFFLDSSEYKSLFFHNVENKLNDNQIKNIRNYYSISI